MMPQRYGATGLAFIAIVKVCTRSNKMVVDATTSILFG
jgi:hypothetical protein